MYNWEIRFKNKNNKRKELNNKKQGNKDNSNKKLEDKIK